MVVSKNRVRCLACLLLTESFLKVQLLGKIFVVFS